MQRLEVSFYDGVDERGVSKVDERLLDVPVGPAVPARPAAWRRIIDPNDCPTSETGSLVLEEIRTAKRVSVGEPCAWDGPHAVSPDGKYLAAWRHRDGAAGDLHVIELDGDPRDLGVVPHSGTTFYSAVWTRDGRVWFSADSERDGADHIWSYDPVSSELGSILVEDGALVGSIRLVE